MPEDITQWREDMNVMSEWQEQDLTSERSEILFLPREHKIHIFKLTCNVLFVIIINILMSGFFLPFSEDFDNNFRRSIF